MQQYSENHGLISHAAVKFLQSLNNLNTTRQWNALVTVIIIPSGCCHVAERGFQSSFVDVETDFQSYPACKWSLCYDNVTPKMSLYTQAHTHTQKETLLNLRSQELLKVCGCFLLEDSNKSPLMMPCRLKWRDRSLRDLISASHLLVRASSVCCSPVPSLLSANERRWITFAAC